jgi:hypothetical protein
MHLLETDIVCIELYVLLQDLYPLVLYQKCILELSINEWMNTAAHVSGCVDVVKNLTCHSSPVTSKRSSTSGKSKSLKPHVKLQQLHLCLTNMKGNVV